MAKRPGTGIVRLREEVDWSAMSERELIAYFRKLRMGAEKKMKYKPDEPIPWIVPAEAPNIVRRVARGLGFMEAQDEPQSN